ncbi:protein FAM90A1-like [Manis javanica]|uniref:protein FAM90A1-like n=1 Tax=Manis javanica TaxID=9974 RepID=UPI003C6D8666
MAGRHPQPGPCSPLTAQGAERQQRGLRGPRASPPELEDPRVKCKHCGAFGHTARSSRCPIRCWQGALAPQPLGSSALKENRDPRNRQAPQNPGASLEALPEKGLTQRPKKRRREAVLRRCPRRPPQSRMEPEARDCARHPNRPMPVYTPKRTCILHPGVGGLGHVPSLQAQTSSLSGNSHRDPHPAPETLAMDFNLLAEASGKRCAQFPEGPGHGPHKRPRLCPLQSGPWSPGAPELGASQCLHRPPRATGPAAAPQGQSGGLPPAGSRPLLAPAQACTTLQALPVPQEPGQQLRMVFTRSQEGHWSSRFPTAPLCPPPAAPAHLGSSLPPRPCLRVSVPMCP